MLLLEHLNERLIYVTTTRLLLYGVEDSSRQLSGT